MNIIKIDSISHGNDGHKLQFVVNVNSKRFDVYFKCRGATLAPTTEAFIGILLLPAMLSNSKIIIEGEVDEKFYNQLPLIQSIYKQWFPSRNFQQVEIENVTPVSTTVDTRSRTATFFSGGIDSYYTFKKKDEHITDFVFIKGFDIGLSNTFLLEKSSALIYESAKRFNKSVIEIDTNVKLFLNKFVGIKIFHGALLSAIGHLLSKEIGRIYIPSTYSYGDLLPFGSHPLLDPMWSSKNFEIVHHGNESSRLEKIKYLNKSGVDLSKLRVCFADNDSMVNCGKCEKCIRTSLGLLAVNGIDSSEINIAALRKLNISPYNRFVYTELLYELEKIGSYPEICYAISSAIYKPMFLQSNIILLKNYLRKQKYRYPNLYRKISRTTQN